MQWFWEKKERERLEQIGDRNETWPDKIEDISKITLETAKLFFYQSEKALTASLDTSRYLDEKASRYSVMSISLMSAFIGLMAIIYKMRSFSVEFGTQKIKIGFLNSGDAILVCCFLSIIFLAFAFWLFIGASKPKFLSPLGGNPKKIIVNDGLQKKGEIQVIDLFYNETIQYQGSIAINDDRNYKKVNNIRVGLVLLFSPIIIFVIQFILFYFQYSH